MIEMLFSTERRRLVLWLVIILSYATSIGLLAILETAPIRVLSIILFFLTTIMVDIQYFFYREKNLSDKGVFVRVFTNPWFYLLVITVIPGVDVLFNFSQKYVILGLVVSVSLIIGWVIQHFLRKKLDSNED